MAEFAAAASRLAGQAGLLFGWRPDEFWEATPAELRTLVEAMTGEEDGLSGEELEGLKRMLRRSPSTTFGGPPPRAGEEFGDG